MRDSFMTPEIHDKSAYYEVSCNHGETHIVPAIVSGFVNHYKDLSQYIEGSVDNPDDEVEIKHGCIWRFSASGYMDCTNWSAASDEKQAIKDMLEENQSDTIEDMESWELEVRLRLLEIDGLGRFEVIEYSSHYSVKDRITDEEYPMSDGVDVFSDGPDIGTEEFRKTWEDSLNENADETLEAYFREQYKRECE